MQTLSPSIDRLDAALKALKQTSEPAAGPIPLGIKCLAVVIQHLREEGVREGELEPLIELQTALEHGKAWGNSAENRRKGHPPSEALLARVSAVIDLLVKAGYEEGEAAQAIMRRLIAVGVQPPLHGGDARGWKRLLAWRSHLLHGVASKEAVIEYQSFTEELEKIPAGERVKTVLDQHLWDRRRKKGAQPAATG